MLQRLKDFFAVFRPTKGKEYKTGVRQYWEMTRLFLRTASLPLSTACMKWAGGIFRPSTAGNTS